MTPRLESSSQIHCLYADAGEQDESGSFVPDPKPKRAHKNKARQSKDGQSAEPSAPEANAEKVAKEVVVPLAEADKAVLAAFAQSGEAVDDAQPLSAPVEATQQVQPNNPPAGAKDAIQLEPESNIAIADAQLLPTQLPSLASSTAARSSAAPPRLELVLLALQPNWGFIPAATEDKPLSVETRGVEMDGQASAVGRF